MNTEKNSVCYYISFAFSMHFKCICTLHCYVKQRWATSSSTIRRTPEPKSNDKLNSVFIHECSINSPKESFICFELNSKEKRKKGLFKYVNTLKRVSLHFDWECTYAYIFDDNDKSEKAKRRFVAPFVSLSLSQNHTNTNIACCFVFLIFVHCRLCMCMRHTFLI